jgi:hypothetical protein
LRLIFVAQNERQILLDTSWRSVGKPQRVRDRGYSWRSNALARAVNNVGARGVRDRQGRVPVCG